MVMKLHIPQVCGMWEETSCWCLDVFFCSPKKGLLRGNDRHSTTKAFARPNFPGAFFLREWVWSASSKPDGKSCMGLKHDYFTLFLDRWRTMQVAEEIWLRGLIDELFGCWLCFRFTINVIFLSCKKPVDNIAHKSHISTQLAVYTTNIPDISRYTTIVTM